MNGPTAISFSSHYSMCVMVNIQNPAQAEGSVKGNGICSNLDVITAPKFEASSRKCCLKKNAHVHIFLASVTKKYIIIKFLNEPYT